MSRHTGIISMSAPQMWVAGPAFPTGPAGYAFALASMYARLLR